ncbi:MAG: hypothetical protein L0H81_01880 [Actinomyces sp.]|nr:hypothetical protein [Actinomyces sp.]MDN6429243.1 hypothetical protein [Propionibacterium sp.]MDN6793770.1 hypothetical protein [Propionibacterium sp.]
MDEISRFFAQGATRVVLEGPRGDATSTVIPRRDADVPAQGFRILYRHEGIEVLHSDDRGLCAGLETVEYLNDDQTFDTALEVRDAPLLPVRAWLMDMSGDRIISWDNLVRLVEVLERLRYNQLELRVGHAFTYRDQDTVWEGTSPLTPLQLRRIETLCTTHGIRLVTAIEPLTHWERWLCHPEYAGRAELPSGRTGEDGRHVPPSELAATPDNAHFVASLVDQLTQVLGSRRINIGGHSTRELGRGASRAAVERRGLARVYMDFIEHATHAVGEHGVVGEMWADVLALDPGLLAEVPAHIVPIVRCAEPPDPLRGTQGFAVAGAVMEGSGRPFWVAPGAGSWNTFCGRTVRARANVEDALQWGVAHGATGILVTAWAGRGHWAPEVLNLPCAVEAAVRAWRGQGPGERMHRLLSALIPTDVAAAVLTLGDVAELVPLPVRNTDITWEALRRGGDLPREWAVDDAQLERARAAVALADGQLEPGFGGTGLLVRTQVRLCIDMCAYALTLVDVARGRSQASREDLAVRWEQLVTRHRKLWLATAREGGLEHSLRQLDPIAHVPGATA